MPKAFTILIPTFNERENIGPLLERIAKALPGQDYEVLFVDDNSKDGTADLINQLSSKYPARVVVRKDKKGLATAVTDGFGWADADTILVMDADLQHPPEVIPSLTRAIDSGADIAVASRNVPGGGTAGWSRTRKIISTGAITLAHVLLPQCRKVKDPMSGFFAFKRRVIEGATLAPIGYKILLEMLVVGKAKQVTEVPFMFVPREAGKSKLNASQEIEYLKHLYSLMRRSGEVARFLKFCLVGGSGVLVNEGLLALFLYGFKVSESWANAIGIEASILSNFALNHQFTFADRKGKGIKSYLAKAAKFNLASLLGAAVNWTIRLLLSNAGVEPLIGNLVGIAVAMILNYVLANFWTWKR